MKPVSVRRLEVSGQQASVIVLNPGALRGSWPQQVVLIFLMLTLNEFYGTVQVPTV